jgi:two-component system, OmpR family, phosphate regulon sensor histidine kinase PhoR
VRHRLLPSVILGIIALVLTVAITVGWNLIFATNYGNSFKETDGIGLKAGYWILMAVGDVCLATVMTVIAIFLGVMIRRSRRLLMQDAFIDRITHELRTPIAALRLAVDTCTRRELDAQTMRQQFTDMRGDLNRLQDLVDHVIDAGRIEHGEWRPQCESVDLKHLAESSIHSVLARYQEPAESVRVHADPGLPKLYSDRVAIEHIFVNLIDNALKYSNGEPQVEVGLAAVAHGVRITVSDRGIGISPKETTKIFRRFYRATNERNFPGVGLGLYVIAQLCRQLGGRISASTRPKGGTVFTVFLPEGKHSG